MIKLIKNAFVTVITALIFVASMTAMDPTLEALAFGDANAFSNRVQQLSGLSASDVDGLYAVEQRAKIILIGVEIATPISTVPSAYYLLLRNANTGAWSRLLIDASEWQQDFEPYFETQGVKIHQQPPETFGGLTAEAEALALGQNDIGPSANANLALYGSVGGPSGSVAAVPQAHNAPVPALSTAAESDSIGTTAGEFRVDEMGAATYSIPIALPSGTAGVAPSISLNYSSSAGNGSAGLGWELSGVSSISRCRKTLAQDGEAAPISMTTDDQLCLDGQRLLLVSGVHMTSGAVYRQELDSNTIVEVMAEAGGEPDFFEVSRPDGSKSFYGRGSASDTDTSAKMSGASSKTINWSIRRFADSVGNPIWYFYNTNSSRQQISEIRYAYGPNTSSPEAVAHARIEFSYESRGDVQHRYVAGHKITQDERLSEIRTYNRTDQERQARRFALTYGVYGPNDEFLLPDRPSRLTRVQECVLNTCFAPTKFDWWHAPTPNTNTVATNSIALVNGNHRLLTYSLFDVNGDGRQDLVWLEGSYGSDPTTVQHRLNYAIAGADAYEVGYFGANGFSREVVFGHVPSAIRARLQPIDYNADGRSDVAAYDAATGEWKIFLAQPRSDGSWRLSDSPVANPTADSPLTNINAIFVDLDSDGLVDYVEPNFFDIKARRLEERPGAAVSSDVFYRYSTSVVLQTTAPFWDPTRGNQIPQFDKVEFRAAGSDFNGDGITDLIATGEVGDLCTGPGGCVPADPVNAIVTMDEFGQFSTYHELPGSIDGDRIQAVDINADGLTDIVYVDASDQFVFQLNRGDSSFTAPKVFDGASGASPVMGTLYTQASGPGVDEPQFVDWDGDGFLDLMWKGHRTLSNPNVDKINVRVWEPSSENFSANTTGYSGFFAPLVDNDPDQSVFLADIHGIGKPEVVLFDSDQATLSTLVPTTNPGYDAPIPTAPNRIHTITNGLGGETQIQYGSLARTDHYERIEVNVQATSVGACNAPQEIPAAYCRFGGYMVQDASAFYTQLNSDWDIPVGHQSLGKSQPVLELSGPMFVTTNVASSAPAAGESPANVNSGAMSSVSYFYREGKVQAAGRGMLGFAALQTVDLQTGVTTTTEYRQDWPFIGRPQRTSTITSDGALLSESTTEWGVVENISAGMPTAGSAALGPLHVYNKVSEDKTYDLVANGVGQGSLITRKVTETTAIDSAGNPEQMVVRDYGAGSSPVRTTTTTSTYFDTSTLPLHEARLRRTVVSISREGLPGQQQRVSEFDYFSTGALRGLLREEIVEPDQTGAQASVLTLVSNHRYDNYGNRVGKSVTGGGITRCAVDTTVYDAVGRYPVASYDCRGRLVGEALAYNQFGSPTVVRDYVDTSGTYVESEIAYGLMGREYFRKSDTGAFQTAYLTRTSTNCPAGTAYKETASIAGGGESQVCHDVLGRTTRTLTRGFDGAWDAEDVEYDSLGRVRRQSTPYDFPSGQKWWTTTSYDIAGRPTLVELPDASQMQTVYSGLTKTLINDKGQDRVEAQNALGEIVSVTDNLNGITTYEYDYAGNLVEMRDAGQNTTLIQYDIRDRKIMLDDPDLGIVTYVYNAFGELERQSNANGHSIQSSYDDLGRLVSRIDECSSQTSAACDGTTNIEGSTTWVYDTASYGLGKVASESDSVSGFTRTYAYDSLGRGATVTTSFDGRVYSEKTTYDQFGRVFQVFDAAGDGTFSDSGIRNRYNNYGYLSAVEDAVEVAGQARTVYQNTLQINARGQVTDEIFGNGVLTARTYNAQTGRLDRIASSAGSTNVQDLNYSWDTIGNLQSRHDKSAGKNLLESFTYDGLNRLTRQEATGLSDVTLTYDAIGNMQSKSDVGNYTYGASAGPHAVTSVAGDLFTYDAAGNNTGGDGRTIKYTTFDKPFKIEKGTDKVEFKYGTDRARYKRIDTNSSAVTTTRYVGSVEFIQRSDGTSERKRYIAGVAVKTLLFDSSGLNQTDQVLTYLHKDHLGSTDVITNDYGDVVQTMSFDAWGQRRSANWQLIQGAQLAIFDVSVTTRGYTGHEMLDSVGIIHMNGRIYDARIGRFLQADPIVQEPLNGQNLNRYSYIVNNPLNATDPSGYAFRDLFNIAVGALVTVASGGISTWYQAALLGAGSGAILAGANGGNPVRGALNGGVSAAAFFAVGDYFQGLATANEAGSSAALLEGGLTAAQFNKKILSHAVVGGVMSELGGGKFAHGFLAAGFSQAFSPIVTSVSDDIAQYFISAMIGGTVSVVSGGKFANGGLTAAFGRAFNEVAHSGIESEVLRELRRALGGVEGLKQIVGAGEELLRKFDSQMNAAKMVAASLVPEANGRKITYSREQVAIIVFALDKLAREQNGNFWGADGTGVDWEIANRTMLLRVIIGHADEYTESWFLHEFNEAKGIILGGGLVLREEEYVNLQQRIHHSLEADGVIAGYHPAVRAAFPELF
ncbi:MAG: RHS repeat-associated core domain-containing protein [Pseudomonadota bacterium]